MTWREILGRVRAGEPISPSIPQVHYRLVEVEKPHSPLPLNKDSAAAVASLQGHPGFGWLLQKLRLQKAQLTSILSRERQKNLTDVEFLQSGIAWTGWIEEQLQRAIGWREAEPADLRSPEQVDRDAFDEIAKFIEVLK